MKIKTIASVIDPFKGMIRKGTIFEVRYLPGNNLINFNQPYQVIEGEFSGTIINREQAIEIDKEKAYTENEWNDMKSYYLEELDKEREKSGRAYDTIQNLTLQLCKKNKEIEKLEFYLEALAKGMKIAGDTIREMRNKSQ